jgi:hypothetical protein
MHILSILVHHKLKKASEIKIFALSNVDLVDLFNYLFLLSWPYWVLTTSGCVHGLISLFLLEFFELLLSLFTMFFHHQREM